MEIRYLTESEINIIRGKALAGHATVDEIMSVFTHMNLLELKLDEADDQDLLGTEGWRHWVGLPDADC